eukprot:scaffold55218_cov75-Phaeocystis_antarctica.AAC.2
MAMHYAGGLGLPSNLNAAAAGGSAHSAWKNVLAVAAFSANLVALPCNGYICVLWTVDRLYTATALEGFA